MYTVATTELPLEWSPETNVPVNHSNLTQTLEAAVMLGIEQAERNEGVEIDPRDFPADDDE